MGMEGACHKFAWHTQSGGVSMITQVQQMNIGQCRRVSIHCISETSWFDTNQILADIKHAGGMSTSQYSIDWTETNSGGYCALVEVEALNGTTRRFLLDAGWNTSWMDTSFQREGVDQMLSRGEIEFVFISHEHMDHFWGLPAVLKYRPDIKIIVPNTLHPEGKELIRKSGHKGQLVDLEEGKLHKLLPGCASVTFDIPIIIGIQGEHGLFFHIKDKGLVTVTGCCHMGVLNLIKYGRENIQGSPRPYGLYGGLHICPFEQWDTKMDQVITGLAAMKLEVVAANHCTGMISIEKMIEAGIPVVRGTARHGSKSDLYVGNGDEVVF
jgi:7,8-dihydropterin-6-yl-methyl-4-(beta-D-ribofuranosyl)aminobenzene 5'-phosphate synthase